MNENQPIIAKRIRSLRKEKGLTQEQLAELLGLNAKSSIANYESGANSPSDEIKKKMCELFDCSMDYLMGKSAYKNSNDYFCKNIVDIASTIDEMEKLLLELFENNIPAPDFDNVVDKLINQNLPQSLLFEKASNYLPKNYPNIYKERTLKIIYNLYRYRKFEDGNEYSKNLHMLPVYGQISAGQPNWAEECIEGYLPIDPELMGILNPEEYFFLRVNGESMNKVIRNGAYALIHKQDTVENGEIAAVLVNGFEATLKKFMQHKDVIVLEPQSDDNSFQTQIYGADEEIKIIGKYAGKFEIN